ncbi:hypothetical protein CHARACLAT_026953, partial [Characodon lateralis]|nr:hypothetical protein [Characodon lateralis]
MRAVTSHHGSRRVSVVTHDEPEVNQARGEVCWENWFQFGSGVVKRIKPGDVSVGCDVMAEVASVPGQFDDAEEDSSQSGHVITDINAQLSSEWLDDDYEDEDGDGDEDEEWEWTSPADLTKRVNWTSASCQANRQTRSNKTLSSSTPADKVLRKYEQKINLGTLTNEQNPLGS